MVLLAAVAAAGCGKDNYDAPASVLEGRVTYMGEALGLAHGAVKLQLYQGGFGLSTAIEVFVADDGSFRSLLFDGDYMLSVPDGAGPWRGGTVPVEITVSGGTKTDLEVVPYYMLRNPQIVLGGSSLRASCVLERVAEGAAVQRLSLFVGDTRFVDGRTGHNIYRADFASPAEGGNSTTQNIGSLLAQHDRLWARIGLQLDGAAELLYGPVVQIK